MIGYESDSTDINEHHFAIDTLFVYNCLKSTLNMSKISKGSLKRPNILKMVNIESNRSTVEAVLQPAAAARVGFEVSFHPGRRLVFSSFNGQDLIHIREYMRMGEREYPTKKGVCFTPGRLRVLRGKIGEIDEALRQQEVNTSYNVSLEGRSLYRTHLGAGIYASISEQFKGVSLRRYWVPEGQQAVVPTKNGIFIPASQWPVLKVKINELLAAHPELSDAVECINSHDNQFGLLDCRECMPFGWII